jgi:hypothetical protein
MKKLLLATVMVLTTSTFAQTEDSKIVSMLSLAGTWNCQVNESTVGDNREFYEVLDGANFKEVGASSAKKYTDIVTNALKAKSSSRPYRANLQGESTVVVLMEKDDEDAKYFATKFDLVVFAGGQTLTFPLQHKKASEFKKGAIEFKLDTGVSSTEATCRVNMLPL